MSALTKNKKFMAKCSEVVVNWKAARLLVDRIGETCPSVRYIMREEKERFGEGFQAVIGI